MPERVFRWCRDTKGAGKIGGTDQVSSWFFGKSKREAASDETAQAQPEKRGARLTHNSHPI